MSVVPTFGTDVETKGSGVQDCPWLISSSRPPWTTWRPYLKNKAKKTTKVSHTVKNMNGNVIPGMSFLTYESKA